MQAPIVAIIVLLFQQNIQLAHGVSCATNPCNLVTGSFDATNGYCCFDISSTSTDSICTCPNNVQPVMNRPCRTGTTLNQLFCNRTCVNGGVCNIVGGQQVCWCTLGFSGSFCEIQGIATRCVTGLCQTGTCIEQTLGATVYAYCYCPPGYTGTRCEQCYYTCSKIGAFPDTAYCAIGRYFYCASTSGAPISAMCPDGQKFDRNTTLCSATYNCT